MDEATADEIAKMQAAQASLKRRKAEYAASGDKDRMASVTAGLSEESIEKYLDKNAPSLVARGMAGIKAYRAGDITLDEYNLEWARIRAEAALAEGAVIGPVPTMPRTISTYLLVQKNRSQKNAPKLDEKTEIEAGMGKVLFESWYSRLNVHLGGLREMMLTLCEYGNDDDRELAEQVVALGNKTLKSVEMDQADGRLPWLPLSSHHIGFSSNENLKREPKFIRGSVLQAWRKAKAMTGVR